MDEMDQLGSLRQEELQPEPQLGEVPAAAPLLPCFSPAGRPPAWLASNPPLGFDETALQFFPASARPLAVFGGFGLLAHPHLWCYDSEGALPFLPMLLVEQHTVDTGREAATGARRSNDESAPAEVTCAAALRERLGAARCLAAVLESLYAQAESWTVQRFSILHR